MSLSLHHRFILVILTTIVASLALIFLAVTNIFTPGVAHRLIKLDEENRLNRAAQLLEQRDVSEVPSAFKALDLPQASLTEVPDSEKTSVKVAGTRYFLVSERPLTLKEANKVARAPLGRQALLLSAALVVLYLMALVLARFVNKPIEEVSSAVRALASGERGVEVPIPKEKELAELAESFNLMSESLATREAELKEALAAKELIFATTSHELRTPLTVILGYCQMLQDGLKGTLSESQGQAVEVMARNARGLLAQVEAILTLSQLRQGSLPFQWEVVDFRELSSEVVENLKPLAEEKGLHLNLTLPDEPVSIRVDYQRGAQIARNLLENAIKYTETGEIDVSLEVSESAAVLQVSDSGKGIPETFKDELFTEFSRGPDTEAIPGTGLGLALSQKLASSMEGKICLEKTGEDGSVFRWTHPLTA